MTSVRGRVMVFWDYDTQWGAERSRSGPKSWGPAEFENTDRLLDLLRTHNVPTTFACVGAAALPGDRPYHDPGQIRRMHAEGHEVGSHSFHHDWLPGLAPAKLRESLLRSRETLENCIGAPVVTFVPPWNQPYDYAAVGSISLSERREVRGQPRTDVPRLIAALNDTGYKFARLAFRSGLRRLRERIAGRELPVPAHVAEAKGLKYVLLNTPAGFDEPARAMVRTVADSGGIAVVWGHPHSLTSDNAQNERHFVPFLEWVAELRARGAVEIVLPRQLLAEGQ
jgi:peptidoglycan/xylan/chitin deacetylase (PgdA/CDA1 family)